MTSTFRLGDADRWLATAAAFWLIVTIVGQWAFFYYIIAFYGTSTITGDLDVWNRLTALGRTPYIEGDSAGNTLYAAHVLGAGAIALAGGLQLIPWIRKTVPTFHRWNGRVFLTTAVALSLSGYYLVWIRKTAPTSLDGLSTSFNGALILAFAYLTYRAARARRISIHRRWAMRLYLVANAQWFLRVGIFAYFATSGALGYDAKPGDPFLHFWTFGSYLLPLCVLQIYLRAKESGNVLFKVAAASLIGSLTLLMVVGIGVYGMFTQGLITG